MARRMTDSAKWEDEWFMNLSPNTKLLWFYLCDCCDHAGVWKVNRRLVEFKIGQDINWDVSLAELGDRVKVLTPGDRWYVRKFVEFQYGEKFNPNNNAHAGVMKILSSHGLKWIDTTPEPLTSPSGGALDMDKDMDSISEESAERRLTVDPKKAFKTLLCKLIVSDGTQAIRKWWSLAKSSRHATCFEDQCDLVEWCVLTARARGIDVQYASHVVAFAAEWRPKPLEDTA